MEIPKNIFDQCELNIQRYERVHGGDINDAYCLLTSSGKYFLKVNDKNLFPAMFEKEAGGLDLLRTNSSFMIPQVVKTGITDGKQWLVLEWLEKGSPGKNFWQLFGDKLALMHRQKQEHFGLDQDNYLGSLQQINDHHDSWPIFYSNCRILPLVKILFDRGSYSKSDLQSAEEFCRQLRNIFPEEPPALLHGDLWAGNYMVHSSTEPVIYDPAVYFGHREMDIGMTRLFGGFDQQFYNAYNETYPLEKNWQKRLPVTQLYPILVHAVLFGGHYISSAKNIIASFK